MSKRKKYSPKVKFQIVLETLRAEKPQVEIARAYDIGAKLLSIWKQEFLKKGYLAFEAGKSLGKDDRKIADLENIIGKQAIEIALLKKFLGHYSSR